MFLAFKIALVASEREHWPRVIILLRRNYLLFPCFLIFDFWILIFHFFFSDLILDLSKEFSISYVVWLKNGSEKGVLWRLGVFKRFGFFQLGSACDLVNLIAPR